MKFVKIDYNGMLEDGTIFATTNEKIAQENNIYEEGHIYKPVILIIGENYDKITNEIIKNLGECKLGDKKEVIIPKELTDKYDRKLVKVLPLSIFKKANPNAKLFPGLIIKYQEKLGKVISVSGGRVTVDFNSTLAEKNLKYLVEVKAIATTDDEKLNFIIEKNFDTTKNIESKIFSEGEKFVEITLHKDIYLDELILQKKQSLLKDISKYLNINKVIFKEEWKI